MTSFHTTFQFRIPFPFPLVVSERARTLLRLLRCMSSCSSFVPYAVWPHLFNSIGRSSLYVSQISCSLCVYVCVCVSVPGLYFVQFLLLLFSVFAFLIHFLKTPTALYRFVVWLFVLHSNIISFAIPISFVCCQCRFLLFFIIIFFYCCFLVYCPFWFLVDISNRIVTQNQIIFNGLVFHFIVKLYYIHIQNYLLSSIFKIAYPLFLKQFSMKLVNRIFTHPHPHTNTYINTVSVIYGHTKENQMRFETNKNLEMLSMCHSKWPDMYPSIFEMFFYIGLNLYFEWFEIVFWIFWNGHLSQIASLSSK